MQPKEPTLARVELSPRSLQPDGCVDGTPQASGEGALLSHIIPATAHDSLNVPKPKAADGIQLKFLRRPQIEDTDGEQVVYPRQTQASELPELPGESETPPSGSCGVRTFVPKPLFGNEMRAHRMRRRVSNHIASSDPESYAHPETTIWRIEAFNRPASASPLASLGPLSPPQYRPPPSDPVQTILNSDRDVPNRSTTVPTANPSVMIPQNRKKPSAVVDLTGRITRPNNYASAHGGFADVWTGHWHTESGVRKVAIKVLRSQSENEEGKKKLNKQLRRELRVWQRLHHENVVPLFGVAFNFGPYTSMVCPWMENGTLNSYLVNSVNTLRLSDRFRILHEVAAGLSYLHSFDIIHGDLTGSNVLINDKGQAMLSDFGLSTIIAEFQGTSYFTSSIRGAVRWAAREIYVINETDPILAVSTHSDVYSFGSVMLQILSNKVPYYYLRNDALVLLQLDKGVYPRRPLETWVTDDLWKFINRCWVKNPPSRPTIREVLAFIDFHYYACALT